MIERRSKMKFNKILALVAATSAGLASAKTVAWWRFDDGVSGGTASEYANSVEDSSIPALTAASIKATTFGSDADYMPKFIDPFTRAFKIYDPVTETYFDNVASLRLRDTYVTDPANSGCAYMDASNLPLDDDFTVECFFRVSTADVDVITGLTWAPILSIQSESYSDTSIQIYKGKMYYRLQPKNASGDKMDNQIKTGSTVLDDRWHHVAMTYSSEDHRVSWFFDYKSVGSVSPDGMVGVYAPDGTKFLIGANGLLSGRNFPGEVDEVRVSDAALEPAEFLHFRNQENADVMVHATFDEPWWGGDLGASLNSRFSNVYCETASGATAPGAIASVPAATLYDSFLVEEGRTDAYGLDMNRGSASGGSILVVDYFNASGNPASALSEEDEFTVEFFCRFKSADQEVYTSLLTDGSSGFRWGYGNNTDGKHLNLQVSVYSNGVQSTKTTTFTAESSIADGKWHHFALVHQRSKRKVVGYIDYGVSAKMTINLLPDEVFRPSNTHLQFGGSAKTYRVADVEFDDIRITGRALSVREFLAMRSCSGSTRLWMHFNNDYAIGPYGLPYQGTAQTGKGTGTHFPEFSTDIRAKGFVIGENSHNVVYKGNTHSVQLVERATVTASDDLVRSLRNVTCEAFVKFRPEGFAAGADASKSAFLLSCHGVDQGSPDLQLRLAVNPSGGSWVSSVVWCKSASSRETMSVSLPRDGRWHHIAITFEEKPGENDGTQTEVCFYLDYNKQKSMTVDYARWVNDSIFDSIFSLGGTWGTTYDYKVDEVRVSAEALTPSQFLRREPQGLLLTVW